MFITNCELDIQTYLKGNKSNNNNIRNKINSIEQQYLHGLTSCIYVDKGDKNPNKDCMCYPLRGETLLYL